MSLGGLCVKKGGPGADSTNGFLWGTYYDSRASRSQGLSELIGTGWTGLENGLHYTERGAIEDVDCPGIRRCETVQRRTYNNIVAEGDNRSTEEVETAGVRIRVRDRLDQTPVAALKMKTTPVAMPPVMS